MAASSDVRAQHRSHGGGAGADGASPAMPPAFNQPKTGSETRLAASAELSRPFLSLRGIEKRFGRFRALNSIDLDVQKGEVVCFLAPPGYGKSTLLRICARPKHIQLTRDPLPAKDSVPGILRKREFLGTFWRYAVASDQHAETIVDMRGHDMTDTDADIGATVYLTFDSQHFHFMEAPERPRQNREIDGA